MKPVETAVWWIEYVLRYEGNTSFLMPGGVHQAWWQRRLLDVWFFAYTVLLFSLALLLFVGWKLGTWLLRADAEVVSNSSRASLATDINYNKQKSS